MSYVLNPGSGSGGTPGGSDKQIQFNDGGSFGGDSAMVFDKTAGAEEITFSATSTNPILKIVQEGSGTSFEVHDSTDPDNNRFQVSNVGNVTIKGLNGGGFGEALYVGGNSISNRFRAEQGSASDNSFTKTGDANTGIHFPAADNLAIATGGTERLRVGSSGQIGIAGANYGASGQVLTSGGASGAVSWTTVSGGGGNDFNIEITDDDVISSTQRFRLERICGWGGIGGGTSTFSNQDSPIFRPFIAPFTGTLNEIGVNCTVADATGVTQYRIGFYDDSDGAPDSLVGSQTVLLPMTSASQVYVSGGVVNNISFTRGVQYWYAVVRNNTSNSISISAASNSGLNWTGPSNNVSPFSNQQPSFSLSGSTNTLPTVVTQSNLSSTFQSPPMATIKKI